MVSVPWAQVPRERERFLLVGGEGTSWKSGCVLGQMATCSLAIALVSQGPRGQASDGAGGGVRRKVFRTGMSLHVSVFSLFVL